MSTYDYREADGIISYTLKSLAFAAFIACEITADPGILFIVLNPDVRGEKRVFWKQMSPSFIQTIDFEKNSATIKLHPEDEIKDTDESINIFCKKLQQIMEVHLFINKLNKDNLSKEEAIKIIQTRCEDISLEIDRIKSENKSRDYISRRIINGLHDVCYAVLILNAINLGYTDVNEKLAWELSRFNIETKYLGDFLRGLKYIGSRIPEEGQSERLMLKYYNYLWEIRKFLKNNFNLILLENLEHFPIHTDTLDADFYEMIASCIESTDLFPKNPSSSRYYIQKKTPFFVNGERYFEITLQLAGLYATKFNRITVYTKQNIATNYSIQIAYESSEINLWGITSTIKVVMNWKVSIDPACLNKLGKILNINNMKLNRKYGEYISLMKFLTRTGMNLFDIINLEEKRFQQVLNEIYNDTNTNIFLEVFYKLKRDYSLSSNKTGKNTIGYIILNLKEEVLAAVMPNKFTKKYLSNDLYISSKCYPFEKNPFISNLTGSKSSKNSIENILKITNETKKFKIVRPYLEMERRMQETGEMYFDIDVIASEEEIQKYNNSLDSWECNQGYGINQEKGLLSIDSYEKTTLFILGKLIEFSKISNRGQRESNLKYIKHCNINFTDFIKKVALEKAFVNSQVLLIYGAAGTGKTTLMNYISNMMSQSKKLFLTKTHTALQNLKRIIDNPGKDSDFISIDSFAKSVMLADYDMVFIDECTTIDNRTMKMMLEKIDENTMLVLAGDIYQIESIDFGNWFYYAKDIITTDGSNVELLSTWRTEKEELKSLWDEVREIDPIIIEKLAMDGPFSTDIGEDIFVREDDDEIVLCLNYDGKFGLNSINLYFQNANMKSQAYSWAEWTFKIGDPIIFLDTKRSPLLYNNLKGRIVDISKRVSSILFTLDINTILTERQCRNESFQFMDVVDGRTRIQLEVFSRDDESEFEEDRIKTIIPFQIAYAVSIHKAQGLEYKSVKIIIPSSNAEKISHSIFYTAITRAKEKLKIYWSAETMQSIVESFEKEKNKQKTLSIIKEKLELQ